MLCELIALGCLVTHGDIQAAQARKLQKTWEADKIINHLEALHQNFYPRPVQLTKVASGTHMERIMSGFLTKAELLDLYRKVCGAKLHRGSLEKLLSPRAESFR
jgi:hypothetical protein